MTSKNGEFVSSNTTSPIVNAPEYRKADYSQYNKLKQEIYSLNRNLYDEELLNQLDELSNVDFVKNKLINPLTMLDLPIVEINDEPIIDMPLEKYKTILRKTIGLLDCKGCI